MIRSIAFLSLYLATVSLAAAQDFRVGQTWACPPSADVPELEFVVGAVSWDKNGAEPAPARTLNIALFADPIEMPNGKMLEINGAHVPISEDALAACGPYRTDVARSLPAKFAQLYADWKTEGGYFTSTLPEFYRAVIDSARSSSGN